MSPIRMTLNFYPRPPRGGRPGCGGELAVNVNISIHALREEGDDCGTQGLRWIAISIHALREEGDGRRYFMGLFNFLFLSTPSARRATFPTSKPTRKQSYFYPRPPRGGRPTPSKTGRRGGDFYPRPPRGGRPLKDDGLVAIKKFLSTPSARRATVGEVPFTYLVLEFLSTPSARRATGAIHGGETFQWNFYPRPPRGGRLETVKTTITGCYFYPRPPRGGRPLHPAMMVCSLISIHALREEGDATGRHHGTAATDFYPRPPRGGRRINPSQHEAVSVISIHALREEGDPVFL